MTETEKMARHITLNQEAWAGLASVDGSHYHPISLPLRGEFCKMDASAGDGYLDS